MSNIYFAPQNKLTKRSIQEKVSPRLRIPHPLPYFTVTHIPPPESESFGPLETISTTPVLFVG
eukprot:scaffold10870_cov84-Cyclotella_meneghiniana.AAC.2